MKTYDFSWIDEKIKKTRRLQHPDSNAAKDTDREIADSLTYPHCIFHWMDADKVIESDLGNNNFAGDVENYLNQLETYKQKFEPPVNSLAYYIKNKISCPLRAWIGKKVLHLNHTKGFQKGDTVYTWDDTRDCVDCGKITDVQTYYNLWDGAKENTIYYQSSHQRKISSEDSRYYKTEEECKTHGKQ